MVIGDGFYFGNILQFIIFVPYETNDIYDQYKTKAVHGNHFYQDHTITFISVFFIHIIFSIAIPKYVEDVATYLYSGTYILNGVIFVEGRHRDISTTISAVLVRP